MTKLKKLKLKSSISVGLLILVAVVAVVSISVKAFSSNEAPDIVAEGNINIENYINEAPAPSPIEFEETLSAMSGPVTFWDYSCKNNDCTYHLTGDMIDASTTIMSIVNPFLKATSTANDVVVDGANLVNGLGHTGATSTVELVRLNVEGTNVATSTFTVSCGASTGPTTAPTVAIVTSDSISTSTTFALENAIPSTAGTSVGGGTVPKIMLGPTYPYLVCNITSAYEGAFTEVTNTFDGKFTVRISRTIQ